MVEKLKNVLQTVLKETYPEIKNIIVIKNEYAENIYSVLVNIEYKDLLKIDDKELKKDIYTIAGYINCRIESVQFF
jgi:23S rRNA maturation-related 3'-5' exoribonuclease YhaM